MYANEIDCFYMIKFYDSTNSGNLSYTDFLKMVLPTANSSLRQLVTQRQNYAVGKGEKLAYEVEYSLTKLFQNELIMHRKIEKGKHDLSFRYDFNLLDAFRSIDRNNDQYITFHK
jgi:hypothetical protein